MSLSQEARLRLVVTMTNPGTAKEVADAMDASSNSNDLYNLTSLTGSADAIPPHTPANYVVNKAGVDAMTLAAPTSGADDGLVIRITSNTANAHTLTATGLLNTGSASVNLATFAAFKGAGLALMAVSGKWNVLYAVGITFS